MTQVDIPFPGEVCPVIDCILPAGHKGYTMDWHSDGRYAWSMTIGGRKIPFSKVTCMQPGCIVMVRKPGSVYCEPHLRALETTMHKAIGELRKNTRRPREIMR